MLLSPEKSLQLMAKYKIPFVKTVLCKTLDELLLTASHLTPPFVLKLQSPDIIHKTDVGGVVTKIKSIEELKEAYKKIISNVKKVRPNARIEGFILQRYVDGLEVIVGGKIDPTFGKIILFGLGGIFTEVFEDTAIRVVPIGGKDARSMITEIKAYKILKGFRGKTYNIKSLVDVLLRTSKLLEHEDIKEMDFNPVIVNEKEAKVVDWRILV